MKHTDFIKDKDDKKRVIFASPLHRRKRIRPSIEGIPKLIESPLGLLEELFADDPWRLLVCVMLLNRTQRVQVDVVLFHLLEAYPTPEAMASADWAKIAVLVQPLGLNNRRAQALVDFSNAYIQVDGRLPKSRKEFISLPHLGDYAYDAHRIFCLRDFSSTPQDAVLQNYVNYQRGRLLQQQVQN